MRMIMRSRLVVILASGALIVLLGVSAIVWTSVAAQAAQRPGRPLGAQVASTPPPYCTPLTWNLVPSPNLGSGENDLFGVAAVSMNSVWAVGYATLPGGQQLETLIEQWSGSSWQVVPSPNVSGASNALGGVATLSAGAAWAVGGTALLNGDTQTLVEQWNGTSWTMVASPNGTGSSDSSLSAVTAVSPNDVWAVGTFQDANGTYRSLAEHWDGTAWAIVASPNPTDPSFPNTFLRSIVAVSSSDVWAVGYAESAPMTSAHPVIEHWNGSAWALVAVPTDTSYEYLASVSAVASNDVWAVGWDNGGTTSLTMHWNGTQWSIVPSPNVGPNTNVLEGVVASGPSDVWAVGFTDFGQSLLEQWNGTAWAVVADPNNPGYGDVKLWAVAAVNHHDIWTVGGFDNGGGYHTRIEQYRPTGIYLVHPHQAMTSPSGGIGLTCPR